MLAQFSASQLGTKTLLGPKGEDMNALRRLRNFWIPWVVMIVLGCFSDAAAQTSYKVTDLGTEGNDILGCAMSLNNEGWTEVMAQNLPPGQQDSLVGQLLNGRLFLDVNGFKFDLGTLGGTNTSSNWGEINDFAQIVGFSETAAPDPNGEDICGFGTHLTCRPFLWQFFQMNALPTLGGNNGQASAINIRGQIVGFAENGALDTSCPSGTTNNRIALPAMWERGDAKPLPLVGNDVDGFAFWINDRGQAVGYSGNCTTALHGASWKNGVVSTLLDLGAGAIAQSINNRGQIAGQATASDGSTVAAVWLNGADGAITSLHTPNGDAIAFASGINDSGQVVGSTLDSSLSWSHAFIWQDNVMTTLDTVFPASANLNPVMANKINERGQISGMAIVMSGPHKGDIHAFLATPVNEKIEESVADVAPTHPKANLPANVNKQLLQRLVPGRLAQ
jgi:probable HAF family extracellular repeat protein